MATINEEAEETLNEEQSAAVEETDTAPEAEIVE